ncbi:MAG: HDIG domain-containing protein [Desulfovibrio sp.]|nr:HDIG domain-containing protein [Desulfovibrio sp.]
MSTPSLKPAGGKFAALCGLPELPALTGHSSNKLYDGDCYALWDKYAMPENIRRHSLLVAHIAENLAELALQRHVSLSVDDVRASALLHDLGKKYSLMYGGAHAAIGAAWVVAETHNYAVAQGVMHHVYWPWKVTADASCCQLPILVLYADKRARHDQSVTLTERFEDLKERYGKNQDAIRAIDASLAQMQAVEAALMTFLGWEGLDAYTFTCRGLVN